MISSLGVGNLALPAIRVAFDGGMEIFFMADAT